MLPLPSGILAEVINKLFTDRDLARSSVFPMREGTGIGSPPPRQIVRFSLNHIFESTSYNLWFSYTFLSFLTIIVIIGQFVDFLAPLPKTQDRNLLLLIERYAFFINNQSAKSKTASKHWWFFSFQVHFVPI